ncbi:MAG: 2-C-methyl-D-erythritol 4-phosphate cytidylyltransferase [Ruminococcaceae bacterium]|nr:2-C-methyl-D-erythritol 4-phosphate cytidylyltransferase [Oscillospiraceae bacterium]
MKKAIKGATEVLNLYQNLTVKNYTTALILAAGASSRMGSQISKQFLEVDGVPVLARSLQAYEQCPLIREIVVVARPQDQQIVLDLIDQYEISKCKTVVSGGADRAESARNGLNAVSTNTKFIAVADGARCLTTPMQIARVCLCAYKNKAASAGYPITDTVKRTGALGNVKETVNRENLWAVQTPQVFAFPLYTAATARAQADNFSPTDDNGLIEHMGYGVRLVDCGKENIKITMPADIRLAEAILAARKKEDNDE